MPTPGREKKTLPFKQEEITSRSRLRSAVCLSKERNGKMGLTAEGGKEKRGGREEKIES